MTIDPDDWLTEQLLAHTKLENENEQMKKLIEKLFHITSKLDLAYLRAVQYGESSFTGEEYDEINDFLIEVEEFLGIKY